jgi:hypothetical protein
MTLSTRTLLLPFFLLLLLLPASTVLATEGETLTDEDGEEEGEADTEDEDEDAELPPWAVPKSDDDEDANKDAEDNSPAGDDGEAAPRGEERAESVWEDSSEEATESSDAADGRWKGGGLLGLGFLVGTDNGLSLKLWPDRKNAVHLHLSTPLHLNSLSVGVSYQIHLAAISIPGSKVLLHPSIGPSFRLRVFIYEDGSYVDGHGGASIGMSVTVAEVPAEIFFEVVPGVAFGINIPGIGIGFDVGGHVGARFYFGS